MSQDRQLNDRSVENQLEERLERARYLLDSGSYEESLGCLIDSFDEFKQLPSWIMTCITDETAKLGRKYPPARAVLEQRRDALVRWSPKFRPLAKRLFCL
jgi:hypothetical protein